MLKNFEEFISEGKDDFFPANKVEKTPSTEDSMTDDAGVANLFQEIDRNYNNYPSLSSLKSAEMLVLEERRDWPDFSKTVELETVKSAPCKFYIRYQKDGGEYQAQVDFNISYKGVENFDIPEPDYWYEQNQKRMGISLEGIKIKKIMAKSNELSYSSSKSSKDLGKTVIRFLLNVFKPQFDMVGDEALIIRQL